MRALKALIAVTLAALVCVAAGVAAAQKLTLRVDGVSHTYAPTGNYLCARVSGTPGARLLVEVYGPGVKDGHTFTESLLGPQGSVRVGVPLAVAGEHRVKVTASKAKQGRAVATRDYEIPSPAVAAVGRFSCV